MRFDSQLERTMIDACGNTGVVLLKYTLEDCLFEGVVVAIAAGLWRITEIVLDLCKEPCSGQFVVIVCCTM